MQGKEGEPEEDAEERKVKLKGGGGAADEVKLAGAVQRDKGEAEEVQA